MKSFPNGFPDFHWSGAPSFRTKIKCFPTEILIRCPKKDAVPTSPPHLNNFWTVIHAAHWINFTCVKYPTPTLSLTVDKPRKTFLHPMLQNSAQRNQFQIFSVNLSVLFSFLLFLLLFSGFGLNFAVGACSVMKIIYSIFLWYFVGFVSGFFFLNFFFSKYFLSLALETWGCFRSKLLVTLIFLMMFCLFLFGKIPSFLPGFMGNLVDNCCGNQLILMHLSYS